MRKDLFILIFGWVISLILLYFVLWILPQSVRAETIEAKVSWYAKGLRNPQAYTTACWDTYAKGTRFLVQYGYNMVIVTCNDRGHFKEMSRFLDLSSGAFKQLAPLSRGIITARITVL